MRKTLVLALLLACAAAPAAAAELRLITVGLVGSGSLRQLITAWSQRTGHTVTLPIGPSALGQVLEAMKTRDADMVLLPMSEMPAQAHQFRPGTSRAIGRVPFALGAKLDAPSPAIATEAEFKAALAGKTVVVNDPAISLNGRMAMDLLTGPGFETVKARGIGSSAANLARSDADYVLTVLPEEITQTSMKVVGEVPASLGLKIDFGGGVMARAASPELAEQFLAFLASAEAAAVWKAGGVTAPVP